MQNMLTTEYIKNVDLLCSFLIGKIAQEGYQAPLHEHRLIDWILGEENCHVGRGLEFRCAGEH